MMGRMSDVQDTVQPVVRSPGDQETNNQQLLYFRRNWVGFFLLGLFTHLHYSVMDTAAYTIVESYNSSSYVALVYGASNGATFLVKNINAFFLVRVSYGTRFLANSVIMLAGITGLAFSQSFPLGVVSIVLVGASNAFGENIALGYLARFDSRQVAAWASGFGLAGLFGSMLYVLYGCLLNTSDDDDDMKNLDKWTFISIIPVVVFYLAVSLRVIKEPIVASREPKTGVTSQDEQIQSQEDSAPLLNNTEDILRVQQRSHVVQAANNISYDINNSINDAGNETATVTTTTAIYIAKLKVLLRQVKRCFKMVVLLAINLAVIQFTSYNIRIAAAKARKRELGTGCPELYASLQLCFTAGVFAAQSSLPIRKIRKVWLLSLLQTVNMFVWVVNERFMFLPVAILPLLMIVSGMLQGAVYVNTFYMIRRDPKYPDEDREMCANVAAIFLTIGLSLSCILQTVLLSKVFLPG